MKKILITGGFGKIAKYFIKNFEEKYKITVADIITDNHTFSDRILIERVDLSDAAACMKLCKGIDIVIHLAGIANPDSTFDEVLKANIIATKNIFESAVKAGCKKIIYASSAQTIEGYSEDIQVNKNMSVRPKNLYGVSKCFGEALGAYYAFQKKISLICLRIGAYEFPQDFTEMNARDLSAYLHPDDFNQLLAGCIETENIQYEILNAISNNTYKRLDISQSKEKVGYQPKANAFELFKLKK
ncbi:NAD-dependent epimerase/dehydratase family protein [Abyssalbus ytuae]|uniref:NAD(P)-dependent oxidoreductase n=1 Tax=Abyssalbus ytuae TaxID=2926907 RepID=A0A9E6ZRY8_9FLAO|nr:NAD(P)-dependent oxidoreductase [Abyssalbus ytuae]UOB17748.1 NAD(P)-dependent oxidoreductase [Abyssalbus ytuae]